MMYDPDPFFEAESVGPVVTFGQDDVEPTPTHAEVQAAAAAEFAAKYGHASPQNLAEANWLNAKVQALKVGAGVTKFVKTEDGTVVEISPTPTVTAGFWGGMTTGGKVAIAGGAAAGVLALVMFGRRRKNPRRSGMLPILAIGGVAAMLIWGGKKTVEAVEAVVPAR